MKKSGTMRLVSAMFAMMWSCLVYGQAGIAIPISDGGTVNVDCAATEVTYFVDDNSFGTDFQDPYSDANYTITLCPNNPGDAVQVNFLSFD